MQSFICPQLQKFLKSLLAGVCTSGRFKHRTLINTKRGRVPRTSFRAGPDQTLITPLSGDSTTHTAPGCARRRLGPNPPALRGGTEPRGRAGAHGASARPPAPPGPPPQRAPCYLKLLGLALLQELLEAEGVLCHHRHGHLPLTAPRCRRTEPPPLRRRPRRDSLPTRAARTSARG